MNYNFVEVSQNNLLPSGTYFTGSVQELISWVEASSKLEKSIKIVTLNLNISREYHRHKKSYDLLRNTSFYTCDGWPIRTELVNSSNIENVQMVSGSDLFSKCLGAKRENIAGNIFVLGGSEKTYIEEEMSPGVYRINPGQLDDENRVDESILKKIKSINPKVIFVCLGFRKQEHIINYLMSEFVGIYIGAGASLDFFTGDKSRAPKVIQNIRLEWAWRLACEPFRLFSRYYLDGLFYIESKFKGSDC